MVRLMQVAIAFALFGFASAGCLGTYEAELATVSKLKRITSTGVKLKKKESIVFNATGCDAGNFSITFRYARSNVKVDDIDLAVGNSQASFPKTGGKSTYTTTTTTITLIEGTNEIELSGPKKKSLEVDNAIISEGMSCTGQLVTSSGVKSSKKGTQFVFKKQLDRVSWSVDSCGNGQYNVTFPFKLKIGKTDTVDLILNDAEPIPVVVVGTSSKWDTSDPTEVVLSGGSNQITLQAQRKGLKFRTISLAQVFTSMPTSQPTPSPSSNPTATPSAAPTATPTQTPSAG